MKRMKTEQSIGTDNVNAFELVFAWDRLGAMDE